MELSDSDSFTLLKMGSNSKIFRYGDKTSGLVLKVVPSSCVKQIKHMLNQYKLLNKLHHENIIGALKHKQNVKISGKGFNSQLGQKSNVLVLEYAQRGNLLDFYKRNRLSFAEIRTIFGEICNAVEYLHSNYVAHRDLKLQNILVFQTQKKLTIKIADFGFASHLFQGQGETIKFFNSFKGTKRGYMAPEIHQVLQDQTKFYDARKTDCFSLGVILFALVLGKLPYEYANKQNKLYTLITEQKYEEFWLNHAGALEKLAQEENAMIEQFKDLFINLVCKNPEQRYDIQDVSQHSWLKGEKSKLKFQGLTQRLNKKI